MRGKLLLLLFLILCVVLGLYLYVMHGENESIDSVSDNLPTVDVPTSDEITEHAKDLYDKYGAEAVEQVNENINRAVDRANDQINDAVDHVNQQVNQAVEDAVDSVKKSLWESFKESISEFFGTFFLLVKLTKSSNARTSFFIVSDIKMRYNKFKYNYREQWSL